MCWKLIMGLSALLLAFHLPGTASSVGGAMASTDDEVLVKRAKEAISQCVKVDDVERFVGARAAINTLRVRDRDMFQRVDFSVEGKEKPTAEEIRKAKHVVLWVRPIKSSNPSVVGIAWMD